MADGTEKVGRIKLKIGLMGAGLVVIFVAIALLLAINYGRITTAHRLDSLEQITNVAYQSITPVLDDVRSGRITRDEALARIRDDVRRLTYKDAAGDNYVFMSSYDGTMLVQPFQREMEMTNNWDLTGSRGTFIIRELVAMARSDRGEGYVTYYYTRPNSYVFQKKISYVRGIPEIDAYIGTGQYMTDLQRSRNFFVGSILVLSLVLVALLILFLRYTSHLLFRQHEDLVRENRALRESREINRNLMDEKLAMEKTLRQAYKMEAVGTLAGGIAHDFNNMLVPIQGYAELLLQDAPPEGPLHDGLSEIVNGAERAGEMVRQILTFSRREKNTLVCFNVNDELESALKLLRATIPTTVNLECHREERASALLGSPSQFHQIVVNLVTNAYHALDKGAGKIEISLATVASSAVPMGDGEIKSKEFVHLSVRDEGCGMAPEVVEKIFDPFFTTKEQGKGTGMGLSVVHGIVESMMGYIDVESAPGKGTRFDLYFPAYEIPDDKDEARAGGDAPPEGSESVLLVDDDERIVKLAAYYLTSLGYRVTSCANGLEGWELFRENPRAFDLVITDLTMPVMTGSQMALRIREIDKSIPLILYTGHDGNLGEDTDPGILDLILIKPLSLKELARKIRDLLDGRRA